MLLYRTNKRAKFGNLPKSNVVLEIGKNFLVFFSLLKGLSSLTCLGYVDQTTDMQSNYLKKPEANVVPLGIILQFTGSAMERFPGVMCHISGTRSTAKGT